jgi:hypothetical protein
MRAARVERSRDSPGEAKQRLKPALGYNMRLGRFLAVALIFALPFEANGQRPDSAVVRRLAERAQVRFERIRKLNLPQRYIGRTDQCDSRIGRFCHWNSPDDTLPAKESRNVVRGRLALLHTLDTLSRRSPRDGWITGQRIRYLLETGDDSTAVRVAASCGAEVWWCDALRGLTLHEAGAGAASDSAFARALAAMPSGERCRWTDMSPLLDASQKKRYGKIGCGSNEEVAERLWWLADAFFSVPGNDRKSEHFARHTMAKILEPARIVYNISWANDIREMIVRYGWARFWTQGSGTHSNPYGGAVSGHEASPNYHFIPASLSLDSLHEVSFDLDEETSPERYAPVVARRLTEVSPQVALFRRSDSVLVVAAFDVSKRTPLDTATVASALVLAPDEKSAVTAVGDSSRGALTALIDGRPHVLSLEVISSRTGHAAWSRDGVWLPAKRAGEPSVSDILLFDPGSSEVRDLPQAVATALPGTDVARGRVGLYWEIYGLARADSALPVKVMLTPVGRNVLRRIGESIGLTERASPLNIGWRDTPGLGSISPRSIVLDLSLVPRGRYEVKVQVEPVGRGAVASTKLIETR